MAQDKLDSLWALVSHPLHEVERKLLYFVGPVLLDVKFSHCYCLG